MSKYNDYNSRLITEIPIIQRDYVQGDDSNSEKRDAFLSSIFKALAGLRDEKGRLYSGKMDFIYGFSEKPASTPDEPEETGKDRRPAFRPIDGQQRLTTLALIGWLLAQKTNPDSYPLPRLRYRTRHTTEQFCDRLLECRLPEGYKSISKYLYTVPLWMSERWLTDPSVKAMIDLLDAADRMLSSEPFNDKINDMARRFFTDSPLEFELLNLPDCNLTEDLYVKMNARGKHLTEFENWKAEFTGMLEDNFADEEYTCRQVEGVYLTVPEYFSYAIEHDWTDMLWGAAFASWNTLSESDKQEHAYPRIDEQFMAIVDFVAGSLFKEQYPGSAGYSEFIKKEDVEATDPSKRFYGEKGEWLTYHRIDVFRMGNVNIDGEENVLVLFKILDAMHDISSKGWDSFFEGIAYNGRWKPESTKINIFESDDKYLNMFECCINGNLTAKMEALFWGILRYCYKFNTDEPTPGLTDFARVFWGWILGKRQRNEIREVSVKNNLRADDYPEMAQVLKGLTYTDDVYESLKKIDTASAENQETNVEIRKLQKSLAKEIEKSRLRAEGYAKVVDRLTGCHYLYGDFSNLIPAMKEMISQPDVFLNRFVEFYKKDEWQKARALIAYGWTGEKVHDKRFIFYGKNGHWDYIFSTSNPILKTALTAMLTGAPENEPNPHRKEYYIAKYQEFFNAHRDNENASHLFYVESDFNILTLRDNFTCHLTLYRQCPYAATAYQLIDTAVRNKLGIEDAYEKGDHGCLRLNKWKYWIECVDGGWMFDFTDGQRWHSKFESRFAVDSDGLWSDTEGEFDFTLDYYGRNILRDRDGVDRIMNVVDFVDALYSLL